MDISNLITTFQQNASEFVTSYCIVNREIMNLNEIHEMGYDELLFVQRSMCHCDYTDIIRILRVGIQLRGKWLITRFKL